MLYGPGIELHWTERLYIENDIDTNTPIFPALLNGCPISKVIRPVLALAMIIRYGSKKPTLLSMLGPVPG